MKNAEDEITGWQIPFEDIHDWARIGGGNFGKVYRASYQGHVVAVKELLGPESQEEDDMDIYYQREMATLKELEHPNVVRLLGLCKHEETLFIITDFVEGGDLRRHLKNKNLKMTWGLRVKIAKDCASALAYLHRKSILHRDFKSKNLLVGPDWGVKVCDFGFARKMAPKNEYMTLCGTDEWMAPEVMLGEKYDEKADVYSFGMVLVEIITREKPVERASASSPYDYEKLKQMTPPSCPYELFKICILCSQFYPINRPTSFEAFETLRLLERNINEGPVKTISDIQAEMAAAARAEEEDSLSDDNRDESSGSDDDGSNFSRDEESPDEADDERLTMRVEQIKEVVEDHVESPEKNLTPVKVEVPKAAATPQQLGTQRFVKAIANHETTDPSELSFKIGDEILFGATDESGWVFGTKDGQSGWFPRNLVTEVPLAGAGPLFKDDDADSVMKTPIKKEDVKITLERGLSHRPAAAELEQKGILRGDESGKKEKKLTLNLLFTKKQRTKAPDPLDVSLKEDDLDALILQLADANGGPAWGKGKKLLTLRSYENVCQGAALVKWLMDKGIASDEKEATLVIEFLLSRDVLQDPAKNKTVFEKTTNYQLALLMTGSEGHALLNAGKNWPEPSKTNPLELMKGLAKRFGMFFKPTPKDYIALSQDHRFRAVALQACELQNVDMTQLSTKDRTVFFVNLHNVLCLHGRAVYGPPVNMLERKRNEEVAAYVICGHVLTASVIVEKLLRGKLAESDPLYPLACKVPDGLSLLGLCDGTRSLPRPRFFSEKTWNEDLHSNVRVWLQTTGVLEFDEQRNTLRLPKVFKTFAEEFGGTSASLITAIHKDLPVSVASAITDIKAAGADLDIQYFDYDFTAW